VRAGATMHPAAAACQAGGAARTATLDRECRLPGLHVVVPQVQDQQRSGGRSVRRSRSSPRFSSFECLGKRPTSLPEQSTLHCQSIGGAYVAAVAAAAKAPERQSIAVVPDDNPDTLPALKGCGAVQV
jgi:hypothetical protein